MFFSGPEARSWERVYKEKDQWIGRDLEVREGDTIMRGPLIDIELDDHSLSPSGNRMIYLKLGWCVSRQAHRGGQDWQPCERRTSFHVNVSSDEHFKGGKMYVERDGAMDLFLPFVWGYRLLPAGDNLIRPATRVA